MSQIKGNEPKLSTVHLLMWPCYKREYLDFMFGHGLEMFLTDHDFTVDQITQETTLTIRKTKEGSTRLATCIHRCHLQRRLCISRRMTDH